MAEKHFFKEYRRKAKTDYGARLGLLKSGLPRLVVRVSSKNIIAQLVDYDPKGDKILCAVSTKSLEKLGWKGSRTNMPCAYLLGLLLAKKTSGKVKKAILDMGKKRSVYHSRIYAVTKGVIDGGIEIPANEKSFPGEDRLNGKHIQQYAEKLQKENNEKYNKLYSLYLKNSIKPESIQNHVDEIKSKIEGVN